MFEASTAKSDVAGFIVQSVMRLFVALIATLLVVGTVIAFVSSEVELNVFSALLTLVFSAALWISVVSVSRRQVRQAVIAIFAIYIVILWIRLVGTYVGGSIPSSAILASLVAPAVYSLAAVCGGLLVLRRRGVSRIGTDE